MIMPKITDIQRESRRQRILDAALRCFSRDGFHATTTADIVRESGVSQGALYLYFATKDDIILALADDRHQGEAFLSALVRSEQDPIEGLALLLELYGDSLNDPARVDARRVGIQGWAEALRSPAIHDSVTEGAAAIRREIVRLVARGQAAGEFRGEVSPEAFARILIALFQGLSLQTAWDEELAMANIGSLIRDMIRGALFTEAARAAHPSETSNPRE
jgi:AcrR family transcriptional regulator